MSWPPRKRRRRKPRAGLLDRHDHIAAVARADRNAFGPAGGNVGQHHRLHEAPRRRRARMRHKIELNKAGRGIIPIAEGANWHRAANCRTHSCPAALAAASDDADLGQKPIVAGLTVSSLPRSASSSANRPCHSSAGNKTGINGLRRLEHSRSEASHNTMSASRTSLP